MAFGELLPLVSSGAQLILLAFSPGGSKVHQESWGRRGLCCAIGWSAGCCGEDRASGRQKQKYGCRIEEYTSPEEGWLCPH